MACGAPDTLPAGSPGRRRTLKVFAASLGVRLVGAGMIWLGDGSPSLLRKAVVAVGVVLSVGGIAVLKYLLIHGSKREC